MASPPKQGSDTCEVMGTVDEFRQKGAIGALRDAALDTRDMATGGASWLWGNVKSLVGEEGCAKHSCFTKGVHRFTQSSCIEFLKT